MSTSRLSAYRDEASELNTQLNSVENQRDPVKYRQLIQQVILYMIKGTDMSPLFATIVKAAAMGDIGQKRLCYIYLCNCASSNPDLALLTINTLKRDAADVNPWVRGLALRSMGSLRIPTLVEYIKDVMLKGLNDHSPYVRQVAVIGCLQLYHLDMDEMKGSEILTKLEDKVYDSHPKVSGSALLAIMDIHGSGNTMTVSDKMARSLLQRLRSYDEWGQQIVLAALIFHKPKNDQDIYEILNYIDPCLKYTKSGGLLLAAVKLFLHLTNKMPDIQKDVIQRIRAPLIKAALSAESAISYTILCHIEILICKAPDVFKNEFSSFFCRATDPLYLRIKKLEILAKIVCPTNNIQIVDELSFHGKREETSKCSIQNIGMIALLHPIISEMCIEKLFSFLLVENAQITSHTLRAFRDVVIKYSDKCGALFHKVGDLLKHELTAEGRASLVWMLGEFAEEVPESPYMLESLVDNIKEEKSSEVKLEMLTASIKLFFKRPPECQQLLEAVLEYCCEQEKDIDVQDRALLYCRLLQQDIDKAREIICCPRDVEIVEKAYLAMAKSKEKLFSHFNTLSVVLGELSSVAFKLKKSPLTVARVTRENNSEETSEAECSNSGSKSMENKEAVTELVPLDNVEHRHFELREKPELSPNMFETLWQSMPETESYEVNLGEFPSLTEIQNSFTSHRIYTMASSPLNSDLVRYFLYAQSEAFILCEISINTSTALLTSVIKMEDPNHLQSFIELFQTCLPCNTNS